MRASLPEARRVRALELASENFMRSGVATDTIALLKQAKDFEDYLRGGTISAKKRARKRSK